MLDFLSAYAPKPTTHGYTGLVTQLQGQMAAAQQQQNAQQIANSLLGNDPTPMPDPTAMNMSHLPVGFQQPTMPNATSANAMEHSNATGGFQAFLNSIAKQESGGNYHARNSGSGAMGKYQIMPSNLGGSHSGWDYEALGRDITPQQFMNSPQLQEAIAQYKLKQYFNKYGPAGAAEAWYGGPGAVKYGAGAKNRPQGNYPSIAGYAASVVSRMR